MGVKCMRGGVWAALALAGAMAVGCTSARPIASRPAERPLTAATLSASPRQVVAAAEQAFIELNLRPTSAEATSRGGCALAETAEGDTITVTATSTASGDSLVRVHFRAVEDDLMLSHLLESIAAHLSVGAHAMIR